METVSPSSANYCEFFEPIQTQNKVSPAVERISPVSDRVECQIEENITVQRNITYTASPDAQQNILNSLSKHLDENFSIKSIDLRKSDKISQPGKIKYIEEDITICIEDHPPESRLSRDKE